MPAFNPFDPAFQADPYPTLRALRAQARVQQTEFGFWLVTGYAECERALKDPAFGRDDFLQMRATQAGIPHERALESVLLRTQSRMILFLNPPDHTRLRALVNKAFTPRTVQGLRPRIERIVAELLDAAATGDGMDVIADFAYPLPVIVICEMLGVPASDRAFFRDLSGRLARTIEPVLTPEILDDGDQAAATMNEYFRALIAERRRAPREDLLSGLIAAEEEGERLSEEELVSNVNLLFGAGHETTMNLIGNGLLALLRNPHEAERLRADPALVPNAIEEMLRYDGSVQVTGRAVLEPAELGGVPIPAESFLFCSLGAANRDPEQFADPDVFDVARRDPRPLTFGGGIHFCLGAPLARLEAQIAIPAILARFPALKLAADEVRWRNTVTLRGLVELPVRF